jgi:hypothetical protein
MTWCGDASFHNWCSSLLKQQLTAVTVNLSALQRIYLGLPVYRKVSCYRSVNFNPHCNKIVGGWLFVNVETFRELVLIICLNIHTFPAFRLRYSWCYESGWKLELLQHNNPATYCFLLSCCFNIWGCIQKFPDWPPGARTVNATALCH